ncbi:hypothetical protein J4206_03900, partial [Candidatus Woesearchaeota archaeon]|nr:hypothetical protein [Candidatus Woesearchaeota archaeon]
MQKKSGDFSNNCSYLRLVMLLVLSAVIVLSFASFASALSDAILSGSNVALQTNYGFNFSTGLATASLTGTDITFNGSATPTGPPDSPGTDAFRVWLVSKVSAKIDGMGPNINLDFTPYARDQSTMQSGTNRPSFPVYAADDGIIVYTEKSSYAIIKVSLRNSTHMVFSYKFNNGTNNITLGSIPTYGCAMNTNKNACFGAGSCFWDDFGGFCKDNTATGGGGSSGGGGSFAIVMCSAFNVKIDECSKLNKSICYNESTTCYQNISFDPNRGVRCEDINPSAPFASGMCDNVPLMATCCSWTGSACVSNATKTTCKDAFNNKTAGAFKFCEDAGNSSTECINLKNNQYMPCRFDNTSTPERIANPRCVFDSSSVFGTNGPAPSGGGFGGGGFFDISTQAACQAASGNWKTFTFEKIDPLYGTKSTVTESKCEPSFGSAGGGGAMSCDQMCPACENNINAPGKGSFSNTTTQAKNQCENSTLGICKFQNISKAPNGLGFCSFDKAYTDFGSSGNCQNDCFACNKQAVCDASKANCTWTNDQFNNDFNGDGSIDGWCDPKAYQGFNSCATNCAACYTEATCNTSALNTNNVNCTWIDSYSPQSSYPLYNVSNAGINPEFGFVGCIKVVKFGPGANRSGELCMYPGDEDGDGLENCKDTDCSMDPACGFGMGGGFVPTIGEGGQQGGPSGGPMGASQLGFGSDCFARDNTNISYCTNLTGCTWKQIGSVGLCDPLFDQQMGGGMQMDAPPTILGTDATDDAGGQDWLDIAGIGYHDSPQNMDLGIGLKNITNFAGCRQFHLDKQLGAKFNSTGKYYRFIDVDANASTGCNVTTAATGTPNNNTIASGYEYKVVYENNGTTEVKLLYKCGLNANQFLNNATKWVLVSKAQVASMDFGCYIDDFMVSQGFAGAHIQILNKVDISNPKQNIKIFVSTANTTTNDTWPVDTAGPFFYTPGSIDFKMEACNVPGADIDGDGYTSDQDPDCAKFKQYGFVPIESGPQCKDQVDNDGNELTDCNDPGCKYDSFQCGSGTGFGYKKDTNDKTAPKTSLQQFDAFPDGGIIKVVTNEPTNATVEFYGTSSSCTTLNETVLDVSLTNANTFDNYKSFHDLHLDNTGGNSDSKLDWTLVANTTYFFKTKTCDLSDNCAKSSCQNFTTKASASSTDCTTCSYVVSFDEYIRPPSIGPSHPLSNLSFTIDFGGDGVLDFNSTGGGTGTKSNYSVTQNTTITFSNPQSSEPWQITLKGLDITGSISSVVSNLSSTFLYNTSGGDTFMGMDGDKFDSFNQNYGVDVVEIKLPVTGDKLKHCDQTNLSNCVDVTGNATKIAQTGDSSTWQFPVTISTEFSLYQVEGDISFKSDKSSYGCNTGEDCVAIINVTNDNTTLKNLIFNISIAVQTLGGTNVTSYGISTWNGTKFNYNGSSNLTATPNIVTTVNLTGVNFSDSAIMFRINFTIPTTFTKGGQFIFSFNATQYYLLNDTYKNFTTSVSRPFVDIINVTSPANSATITTETTTFTYTLFSEFNTVATYNQTCYLRLNGTIVNSSVTVNGTAKTLSNNVTIKDGAQTWNVSCQNNETSTDAPGFSVTRTLTGTSPPEISITYPTSAVNVTNDNTTTITFTLNDTGGINNLTTIFRINSTDTGINATYNITQG